MDLANLEKMKVVELRNELQTRGLDTKGVKAVLIERLRSFLEGGGTPNTPSRRSRRTRSMTRSPSPSPVKKKTETILPTVEEEESADFKHSNDAKTVEVVKRKKSSKKSEHKEIRRDKNSDIEEAQPLKKEDDNSVQTEPIYAAEAEEHNVENIILEEFQGYEEPDIGENLSNQYEEVLQEASKEFYENVEEVQDEEFYNTISTDSEVIQTVAEQVQLDYDEEPDGITTSDLIQDESIIAEEESIIPEAEEEVIDDHNVEEEEIYAEERYSSCRLTNTPNDDDQYAVDDLVAASETVYDDYETKHPTSVSPSTESQQVVDDLENVSENVNDGHDETKQSGISAPNESQSDDLDDLAIAAEDIYGPESQQSEGKAATVLEKNSPVRNDSKAVCVLEKNSTAKGETKVADDSGNALAKNSSDKNESEAADKSSLNDTAAMSEQIVGKNETETASSLLQNDDHSGVMSQKVQDNGNDQKSPKESEQSTMKKRRSDNKKRSKSRSRSPYKNLKRYSKSRSHTHSTSRSRTRSRSPKRTKHGDSSPTKAFDDPSTPEDEPTIEEFQFGLSWFDSDLHLRIDPVTFTSARPMNHDIYALIWSGARANYGVRQGKVCFEVRLSEESILGRSHEFRDEPHIRGFRVGFSLPNTTLLLGEAENSFAYCESGRKATKGDFTSYGPAFTVYDVIGCYLDLDSNPCNIKYTLNGEDIGVAFEFDKSILDAEEALFPHILTKGYEYQVNFADNDNLLVNMERKVRKKPKPAKMEKIIEEKRNKDGSAVETEGEKQEGERERMNEKVEEEEEEDWDNCENEKQEEKKVKDESMEAEKEEQKFINQKLSEEVERAEDVKEEVEDKTCKYVEKAPEAEEEEEDANSGASPMKRQKLELPSEGAASQEPAEEEIHTHSTPRPPMSLLPNYELIALIPEENYIIGPQRPESRKDCEVILMIGLPGSGKTTWVHKHMSDNPDKRYHVIGADALLDKMTVDGAPRKTLHKGRFERVHELCFNILTSLEDIAVKRRRNFILDQTNAYASAQRRKMKGFGDFKRIAVVCLPKDEELKRRLADKKEKGQFYPTKESTLNNIQANFSLPSLDFSWFDDIIYTDLSGDDAKKEVRSINQIGKKALDAQSGGSNKRGQRRDNYRDYNRRPYDEPRRYEYDNRWHDRRSGHNMGSSFNYYHHGGSGAGGGGAGVGVGVGGQRWSMGGGGSGGYRNGASGGYRDDRNRNYNQRFAGGGGGVQNWVQNSRNPRYDDRNNRYGGGSGGVGVGAGAGAGTGSGSSGRYDAYSSGGNNRNTHHSGGDYRDRDNRDRNRNAGGGSGRHNYDNRSSGSQRDFRAGHRDTREDSRGGPGSTGTTATKYNPFATATGGNANPTSSGPLNNKNKHKPTDAYADKSKWNTYSEHQQGQQVQQYHQQYPAQDSRDWQHYTQQTAGHHQQQQQQQWNYNITDYINHEQWQSMDVNQQQQWMSWWQQQQHGQIPGENEVANSNHQYWAQYPYNTQTSAAVGTENTSSSTTAAPTSKK